MLSKQTKQDLPKDDSRSGKGVVRTSHNDRDSTSHISDGRIDGGNVSSGITANGNPVSASGKGSIPSARPSSDNHNYESKVENALGRSSDARQSGLKDDGPDVSDTSKLPSRLAHSPRHDYSVSTSKSSDKLQKRASPAEEVDRLSKRRKGDAEIRDFDGEIRISERERSVDARFGDPERSGTDEQGVYRLIDKPMDRTKDKGNDRHDKDYRDRLERPDKLRGDDLVEKVRDRSMERYVRERSVERAQERGNDRSLDRLPEKPKDDRNKVRYSDTPADKSLPDDRFHGQNLPPPPPLPPHLVPQSLNAGRRDEDADRRFGTSRHGQRLSPRHEEKERRRSEESIISQDDSKRRREEAFRERKREEREGLSMKVCFAVYNLFCFVPFLSFSILYSVHFGN